MLDEGTAKWKRWYLSHHGVLASHAHAHATHAHAHAAAHAASSIPSASVSELDSQGIGLALMWMKGTRDENHIGQMAPLAKCL